MNALIIVNSLLFAFSMLGILLVFLFYPLFIWVVYLIKEKKIIKFSTIHPSISLIIVVHNAEHLIVDKIRNSILLNYPSDNYEVIIFSDGSTDGTENLIKPYIGKKVRLFSSSTHEGKISAINNAVQNCSGEIIVFSDVDAILESNAIVNLVKYFADPKVGGVCGQRIICKDDKKLKNVQSDYISFDSIIKKFESRIGNISSNDGKLFAIKRELFLPIPPAVTDDLYVCLSIAKQNHRFLFEPEAKAFIKVPSRSPEHEVERRRRIVSTSLRGIWLLNPFKYGLFSLSLIINKIVRRLLPICLLFLFISSLFLSFYNMIFKIVLFPQIGFYFVAFSYWIFFQHIPSLKIVRRISSLVYYFCLGNYGTLLGLFDFLMGRQIVKWKPVKTDK